MKTTILIAWPSLSPEPNTRIAGYPTSHKSRNGVVKKLLTTPTPPDEATIRKLNELATRAPFCSLHKVKKHDLL